MATLSSTQAPAPGLCGPRATRTAGEMSPATDGILRNHPGWLAGEAKGLPDGCREGDVGVFHLVQAWKSGNDTRRGKA